MGFGFRVSVFGLRNGGVGYGGSAFGDEVSGMEFRVGGFRYGVSGFGFQVGDFGIGFRVWGRGVRVRGSGFGVLGCTGFQISDSGIRDPGFESQVPIFGFQTRLSGTTFRPLMELGQTRHAFRFARPTH